MDLLMNSLMNLLIKEGGNMSGRYSRQKGYRGEYNLINKLKSIFEDKQIVQRIPLSGQTQQPLSEFKTFKSDIVIKYNNKIYHCEVKVRKNGFKEIYKLINENNIFELNDEFIVTKIDNIIKLLDKNIPSDIPRFNLKRIKMIEDYIKFNDILFIKSDRKDYIILMKKVVYHEKKTEKE